ncbi:MAG: DUF1501 domain-containing protein [Pirellulales bacterium]
MSTDAHAWPGQGTAAVSRRELLGRASTGFGMAALAGLLGRSAAGGGGPTPRAKRVIFLFMSGGVSQVDSFDHKPLLAELAGKPMPGPVALTQFNQNGTIMPTAWPFRPRGQSGIEVSDLFPEIATRVDDLAIVRSMTTKFSEHAQGNLFIHTGFPFLGYPSAGSWLAYGLGRETEELPGYVVLRTKAAGIPHGGVPNYGNGFLPSDTQGSLLSCDEDPPLRDIRPAEPAGRQRRRLDYMAAINRRFGATVADDDAIEAAISTHETAFRMQAAVPALTDLSDETEATKRLYGLDAANAQDAAYARQCLIARRLCERGVRFIELSCLGFGIGGGNSPNPWDQHNGIKPGHAAMARQVDRPIAALLTDLRQRGLLDETLVVWAGEFGRTPFAQGSDGRDHDPFGFSVWLAGGGVRGGTVLGATDEFGYRAVADVATFYDLWATVLHQLGIDHTALTFRHGGRDMRLTDVHGNVLTKLLA